MITFELDATGVLETLHDVGRRAEAPAPGIELAFRALEHGEAAIFSGYGGEYVDTGALRASLTRQDASGAIREAHGSEARFGSSVFYARFQGTKGPGDHAGPSAVLRETDATLTKVGETVLDYIVNGLPA